jgi:hypothetical protein
MGKKDDTVLGVGCWERDVGSVGCGMGKVRSDRESRDCMDRMMILKSNGGVESSVIQFGFQTLN